MPAKRTPAKKAALSTAPQGGDPCLAFVTPPCHRTAERHHLCSLHKDGYEGTNWTRQEATSPFTGRTFTYVALDTIPPTNLIDPRKIVRLIHYHEPCHGRCPCCNDPMVSDTSAVILHTTWRPRGDASSVCTICIEPNHKHVPVDAPRREFGPAGFDGDQGEPPEMPPLEVEEEDDGPAF
jgi:hypothetical protein